MEKVKFAIIGGSGITDIEDLIIEKEININTPYGLMSDKVKIGYFKGTKNKIAFLPRHGKGHVILPSNIPQKANVWGLKYIGVEKVIAISAVGSLKEEIKPTDFVVPSQIFDRTKNRDSTFFEDGLVGHISFANPFCPELQSFIAKKIQSLGLRVHTNETYVCMEGPAFSTKAESNFYRMINAGVIGMTALPEAKLFREAEICYGMIAMSTDYDCWREGEEVVNVAMVIENVKKNVNNVKMIIKEIFKDIPEERNCECVNALQYAVQTSKDYIDRKVYRKLELFLNKYF